MTSSEPTFNLTRWGNIPQLTYDNYDKWKDNIIPILSAIKAYTIVTGENPESQPLAFDHDDTYDVWMAKKAEAACIIRLSCSSEVRRIVKGIRNPHTMWNTLETSLDTAGSYIGRQDILRQFRACQPKEDEPFEVYFTKLSNYHIQLDHTDDAVTDQDFHTQIFTSLPSQYEMMLMVLKHRRPLPTPEAAMHDLLEEDTTDSLTKEHGDAPTGAAHFSQRGSYRDRGLGVVDVVDTADAEDAVDIVDTVEAVEPETATKVSAPIAKLTAILRMHAGSRNAPSREETTEETTSALVSSAGSQATSKSIASPTNG